MVSDNKKMSEDKLQQLCYLWFHNTYSQYRGLLFHPANGGSRNSREGAKFKSMGVVPGVADLLFIFKDTIWAIELKTETGTQSDKQKEWENVIWVQGIDYCIVRSLKEFQRLIKSIIDEE